MPIEPHFTLHPQSTLLRPDAPGFEALYQALATGQSILARQHGTPITARSETVQRLYCQSSGTTGEPKTVRRSPASWIASFEQHRARFDLGPKATSATLGPLGHSLPLFASLEALHLGADLLALHGLNPKRQAAALARHTACVLYATPTQVRLLIKGCEAAGITALPAMRHILCGGGPLDPGLRPLLRSLCPHARTTVFYGASETSFVSMEDENSPERCVGRPYPGVRLEIRHEGQSLPHGETGEIWVTSPYLFEGYEMGSSGETRWDAGFLSVGEMGYLDAYGHLHLRGRKARMVLVADQNVFLDEIETVIAADPAVRHCAALALPDALRGTGIICVIEADPCDALEHRLRAMCRAQLGASSVPRRILVIPSMPLLPAGKPDLTALSQSLEPTP